MKIRNVLPLALATGLVACSGQSEPVGGSPPPAAKSAAPAGAPAAPPAGPAARVPAAASADDHELPEEAVVLDSGLAYVVLEEGGEGETPELGDFVTVHYTGTLTDGTKFDSSRDRGETATFQLGNVIAGWNEGLALMTPGARWQLVIPPELGYGPRGNPPRIPPNATLLFDVELISFQTPPELPPGDPSNQTTDEESGVVSETIVEGEGEKPGEDDVVTVAFHIFSTGGDLIESSLNRGPYKGDATGMSLPFMSKAIYAMNVGSKVRLEVPADPAKSMPQETVWVLELLDAEEIDLPAFVAPVPEDLKTTESGLQYQVVEEGEGETPTPQSRVTVHYAGWLTDGTSFDASYKRGEPTEFPVGGVIAGWTEGLQLMKEGAVYRFVIPAKLAYGAQGSPPVIPPNANLIFHVELIDVQ